jgi:hypothetical protein
VLQVDDASDAPAEGDGDSTAAPPSPPSYWRTLASRAAILFGLSALAVTQPLLELFGRNPEFFVAGRYSSWQIVAFAAVVAVAPAALATALVALASAVHRRLGAIVFAVLAGVFGAAIGLVLLRSAEVSSTILVAVLAIAAGVAIAVLTTRTRAGRLLASYLALAAVVFLGLFLVASPASALVWGGGIGDRGRVDVPVPAGPVVWIVLDEMPAATIMRADGTINDERYPGFAELAEVSDWYRNASSPYNLTHRAVPAMLEGQLAESGDLPRYQDHPRTLFTLLGDEIPVERYESVTDLCPPTICIAAPREPLTQALHDAAVVYGHRTLPPAWRGHLPSIDQSWGSFGQEDDTGTGGTGGRRLSGQALVTEAYTKWRQLGAAEKSPLGQAGILREQVEAIGPEPAVHFIHVALPHRPWILSASGISSTVSPTPNGEPGTADDEFSARLEFQLHSMQVGAADRLVGELVERLKSLPTWEDTLLVVTSDHGTNLTPPNIGRMHPTDATAEEVYRVPLFIKAPGQTRGEIHDEPASTLDILPTVVDLLGGEVDWHFDGHSLVDGSSPVTPSKVSSDVGAVFDIAARRAREFPYGDDWLALAAVGPNGDLVGSAVDDHTIGAASDLRIRLDDAKLFADLPTAEGTAPFVLPGTVVGSRQPESDLVVAINGQIAGILGDFRRVQGGSAVTGYVADLYRPGANDVTVYEVERAAGGDVTLHELPAA